MLIPLILASAAISCASAPHCALVPRFDRSGLAGEALHHFRRAVVERSAGMADAPLTIPADRAEGFDVGPAAERAGFQFLAHSKTLPCSSTGLIASAFCHFLYSASVIRYSISLQEPIPRCRRDLCGSGQIHQPSVDMWRNSHQRKRVMPPHS